MHANAQPIAIILQRNVRLTPYELHPQEEYKAIQ